ncbi:MAG: hypothetical protein BWY41_01538 [Candidatus Atribacteria bacterium ADurb.Bin276]|jgi:hypothetical protein|uniref:Uncharacterized protein n=1 Tax=Candidatus Atribacter allofermentans TaxID=1852833 RepID=A0A1V5SP27_9BACT|nr:MAG: hypothetical protein BWY41_01538 [Candidatus Atribacteria bacterium ADurb.Bin276]
MVQYFKENIKTIMISEYKNIYKGDLGQFGVLLLVVK